MAVKVKVKLFREGESEFKWVLLDDDSTGIRALLEMLSREKGSTYIQEGCITIVNKTIMVDDIELSDGDEIEILPMLQGG